MQYLLAIAAYAATYAISAGLLILSGYALHKSREQKGFFFLIVGIILMILAIVLAVTNKQ